MLTYRGQVLGTIISVIPMSLVFILDLIPKPDRFGMIHYLSPIPMLALLALSGVMIYWIDTQTQKSLRHQQGLMKEIEEYNRRLQRDEY